ncbi:hypothetical protein FHS63_000412 [Azospirillum doebereinerae]
MSLMGRLGVILETNPTPIPYLPPSGAVRSWNSLIPVSGTLRAGWCGRETPVSGALPTEGWTCGEAWP